MKITLTFILVNPIYLLGKAREPANFIEFPDSKPMLGKTPLLEISRSILYGRLKISLPSDSV
jgi:hypothetical protein